MKLASGEPQIIPLLSNQLSIQVIAWCLRQQAITWPKSMSPYGVIRPQWVKISYFETHLQIITSTFLSENQRRLSNFVVALRRDEHPPEKGPFPDSKICHKHRGYPRAAETITVTCHAAMMTTLARYVYVYLEGKDRILTLCELEVYGHRGKPHICFSTGISTHVNTIRPTYIGSIPSQFCLTMHVYRLTYRLLILNV